MLFASLASPDGLEGLRGPVTGLPMPAGAEDDDEEQELLAQVEASQGRANELEKVMAQEEERIQQMAEEELRWHRLHQRLLREMSQQPPPTAAGGNLCVVE